MFPGEDYTQGLTYTINGQAPRASPETPAGTSSAYKVQRTEDKLAGHCKHHRHFVMKEPLRVDFREGKHTYKLMEFMVPEEFAPSGWSRVSLNVGRFRPWMTGRALVAAREPNVCWDCGAVPRANCDKRIASSVVRCHGLTLASHPSA